MDISHPPSAGLASKLIHGTKHHLIEKESLFPSWLHSSLRTSINYGHSKTIPFKTSKKDSFLNLKNSMEKDWT